MAIRDVALAGLSREQLLHMHYQMVLIRRFEEKAAEEYTLGKIGGFLHLYIGQEANGVGALSRAAPGRLRRQQLPRAWARHPQRALSRRVVMAELFGKATGMQQGQGRLDAHVQHRAQRDRRPGHRRRAACSSPPASASPSSTRSSSASLSSLFGDGAVDEGAFHESLNCGGALEAAGRLPLREQSVLDGHGRHQGLVGLLAGATRRRLWHGLRPRGRHGCAGRARGDAARPPSGRARARARRLSNPSPIASVATRWPTPPTTAPATRRASGAPRATPSPSSRQKLKEDGVHDATTRSTPTNDEVDDDRRGRARASPKRAPIPTPTSSTTT